MNLDFEKLQNKYSHLFTGGIADVYLLREALFGFSEIYEFIDRPEVKDILEVGSGPGLLMNELSNSFPDKKFVGVEPFQSAFNKFEKIYNSLTNLEVHNEWIKDFSYDTKFDLIFSVNVCEHVDDWKGYIDKTMTLLKDGGTNVIMCPIYDIPYENHTIIPVVINKDITYKIFEKKIRKYEVDLNLPGNWETLNFIKARDVKKYIQEDFDFNFDNQIPQRLLKRLTEDKYFLQRHGMIGSICKIFYNLKVDSFIFNVLGVPFPYMKVSIFHKK